jgi:ankyrin repeat protein
MFRAELFFLGTLLLVSHVLCFTPHDLSVAVKTGNLKQVNAIIEENAVNLVMKFSKTPAIHSAAENGHTAVVKALLDAGVSATVKNFNNTGPMLYAVLGDHPDVIDLLHRHGADINEEILQEEVYYPLLILAARQGSVRSMEKLIDLGCDIDQVSRPQAGLKQKVGYDTALIGAAFSGQPEVIAMLLKRGANKAIANRQGNTALHAATFSNNPPALKQLLDSGGFNVSALNTDGFGAVHLAAHSGAAKCLRLLLKAGASVDTAPGIDFNPLIVSVRTHNLPLFKEVMSWKPNINAYDSVNFTAVYHALSNNHIDMANQLLRKGAHLGAQNGFVKGIIDEWTRFVVTCDWFYGLLRTNGLSTKQVSGPEPHLGYCDLIQSLKAHKSIVKLIDQADLYGYDGLVSRLNFKSFTDHLDGNFEGVRKAKEMAYADIKHLHKIDYRKKYEVDVDEQNEQLPNILHRFSDKVEPPRPKEEKEMTLSDILGAEDTVRQVHRPAPEDRPQHMKNAEAVPIVNKRKASSTNTINLDDEL